jgi:hypothetical protein
VQFESSFFNKNNSPSQPQKPEVVVLDEFKGQLPLIAPQSNTVSRESSKSVSPALSTKSATKSTLLDKLNRLRLEKNDL